VDRVAEHLIDERDWTALDFFQDIGALDCGDRRFALFLQELLSGAVNPSEERLRALASAVNPVLEAGGITLTEIDPVQGYPAFSIERASARHRPPRLILFASRAAKPDVRLADVLDADIEVLTANDQLLRYDRTIGPAGLHWGDLHEWWSAQTGLPPDEAKASLWKRLLAAIPDSSEPQRLLFHMYYTHYGSQEPIALLPEVWLHWDPQTVAQRGDLAYRTHRMDFLMLLTDRRRVVLEVDGRQHYSDGQHPSPSRYADTMRGDRDLRLSGYEVYRFGASELTPDRAEATVREFFDRLLRRHVG